MAAVSSGIGREIQLQHQLKEKLFCCDGDMFLYLAVSVTVWMYQTSSEVN